MKIYIFKKHLSVLFFIFHAIDYNLNKNINSGHDIWSTKQ